MAYRKVGRHLVACPSCLHSSSLTFTRPCRARGLSAVLSELVATPRWCLGSFTAGWLSTARGRSSSLASIETCAPGLQHIHAMRRCTCNFFFRGVTETIFFLHSGAYGAPPFPPNPYSEQRQADVRQEKSNKQRQFPSASTTSQP